MFARHSLVWLDQAGWDAAAANAAVADLPVIARWRGQDWPAIVRRAEPGTPRGQHCLGIAAPPCKKSGQKMRVALCASEAHITRVDPPLMLGSVLTSAPEPWRAALGEFMREAAISELAVRVYGSLAMQALTGQQYLSTASDIDLLVPLRDAAALCQAVALLKRYAAVLPLDGELLFPSGHAVSWKEWVRADEGAPGARVLVKHADAVSLMGMASLRSTLEQAHA